MKEFNSNDEEESNSAKPLFYNDDSNISGGPSEHDGEVIDLMSSSAEEHNEPDHVGLNPMFLSNKQTEAENQDDNESLGSEYKDGNEEDDHSEHNSEVDGLFNNTNADSQPEDSIEDRQNFTINSDEIGEMEKEDDKMIELALANVESAGNENNDEEHVLHFDNILKNVSSIKADNVVDELTKKNTFLLEMTKKLSSQASSFKTKYAESVIEKDELIGDHNAEIETREEELDNLQQDIDELELHGRKYETKIKDLKDSNDALRKSRKDDLNSLMDKLARNDTELKTVSGKLEFESQNRFEKEKLYNEFKVDNESLLMKISMTEHSKDTDIGLLKSELVLKEVQIRNLENQLESFKRAGISNNVSADDYNSLVDSFKKSSDEIMVLRSKLDERDHDLKELLDAPTEGFSNSNELLKKELLSEKIQKEQLQNQLEGIIADLEISLPAMREYKSKCSSLEDQLQESISVLDSVEEERNQLFDVNLLNDNKIDELNEKLKESNTLNTDLAAQVQFVLLQLSLRTDANILSILSPNELALIKKLTNKKNSSEQTKNIQNAISDNLVLFHDIKNLQDQNQHLLLTTRKLGDQLETLQSVKDHMSKVESLETSVQKLEVEKENYEKKIKILTQQHKNLDTIAELQKGSRKRYDTERLVSNFKVQISNLEKQLVESHERILKQSEENSTSTAQSLSKMTELNFEISSLKSDNSIQKFKFEQLEKEKDSLKSLLDKEREAKAKLNKLLATNESILRKVELELNDSQIANINGQKSKNDLSLKLQSLDQKYTKLKTDNNVLLSKVNSYKADLDRIQGMKKEIDYLLRHSDADYWSNLAAMEQKLKQNGQYTNGEDKNSIANVSNILGSFEKHMNYHSNQAQEFRKLLAEKDELIKKLNINTRVQELVDELANKKKEYDDLSEFLDSKNNEITQANQQLLENSRTIASITNSCNTLKEELNSVHETVTEKNTTIAYLQATITNLTTEKLDLESKLKSLEADFKQKVKNLEIDYDDLEHTCKEFEQRYLQHKKESEELLKQLETNEQQNNEVVEEWKTKFESTTNDLQKKDDEFIELSEKLNAAKKDLADLKLITEDKGEPVESDGLKDKFEELTQKNEELTKKLAGLEAETSEDVQKAFDDQKQEVEQLKKELDESTKSKSTLIEEMKILEESKKVCEDKIAQLEQSVSDLQAKQQQSTDNTITEELESKIKLLEKENREQRASVLKVKLLEQKLKKYENQNTSRSAMSGKASSDVTISQQAQHGSSGSVTDNSDNTVKNISQKEEADEGKEAQGEEQEEEQEEAQGEESPVETTTEPEAAQPLFSFSFPQPESTGLPPQQKPAFFTGNNSGQSLFGQSPFGQSNNTQSVFGNKRPFAADAESNDDADSKKPKFVFGMDNKAGDLGKSVFGDFYSKSNENEDENEEKEAEKSEEQV